MAEGLDGSVELHEEGQGKDPAPGNKGPDSGMMLGAKRRAYRILIVAAALVAALVLRNCSLSLEVESEMHHHESEGLQIETPTPVPQK